MQLFFLLSSLIFCLFVVIFFLIKIIVDDYKTTTIDIRHLFVITIFWYLFFFILNYMLGYSFYWNGYLLSSFIISILLGILSLVDNLNPKGLIGIKDNLLWFNKKNTFYPITAVSDILGVVLFFVFLSQILVHFNNNILLSILLVWIGGIIWLGYHFTISKYNKNNLYYNIYHFDIKTCEELDNHLNKWKYIKAPNDFKETKDFLIKKEEMKKVFSSYERFKPWHIILWSLIGFLFLYTTIAYIFIFFLSV